MRRVTNCDRRVRTRKNEITELEFERILKLKSVETLQKLQTILELKQTSTDPELADVFEYINQTTSISDNDSIYLELVKKIFKEKQQQKEREQRSPFNFIQGIHAQKNFCFYIR